VATTPTQIRIPPDVKAWARERAESEGTTLSEVVVRLLREYIEAPRQPPPERREV
jgi:hypothetical protein